MNGSHRLQRRQTVSKIHIRHIAERLSVRQSPKIVTAVPVGKQRGNKSHGSFRQKDEPLARGVRTGFAFGSPPSPQKIAKRIKPRPRQRRGLKLDNLLAQQSHIRAVEQIVEAATGQRAMQKLNANGTGAIHIPGRTVLKRRRCNARRRRKIERGQRAVIRAVAGPPQRSARPAIYTGHRRINARLIVGGAQ